jgi:hypothetical protein
VNNRSVASYGSWLKMEYENEYTKEVEEAMYNIHFIPFLLIA